ncbi:MAG: serine/threonine protein kinase [Myxococcales bacterium]|nr:serine/threonine protein kinase [Myxococcales bacterium]
MEDTRVVVGQVLAGRYWLQEHLGRGAMGDVFKARHTKVARAFAVKVLHPQLIADPKVCVRFEREAELAGKLRHRNVINVLDVGETARSRYIVMEFAEGRSLTHLIADGPMEADRAIGLLRQICDGLHHAHEHELIHRDLKPDNIIVEVTGKDEHPRIVDFGLAIIRDGAQSDNGRLTTRGLVLGTPHYLAPETAMGKSIDRRADLFALGVIMFEMLTGVMPFDGDGVHVATANVGAKTPTMQSRAPHVTVDPLLEALTRALLAKRPEQRPATALEVRRILGLIQTDREAAAAALGVGLEAPRALTDAPIAAVAAPAVTSAHPVGSERDVPTDEMIRQAQPRRRIVMGISALVLLLAAGVTGLALGTRSTGPSTRPATITEPVVTAAPAPNIEVIPLDQIAMAPTVAEPPPAPRIVPRPPTISRAPTVAPTPPPPATTDVAAEVVAASPPVETGAVTSATVLQMYAALGRQLKRISDRQDLAADDLWQRYRRVRIQEAIATSAKRSDAMHVLSAIEHEIETRFNHL